MIDRDAIYQSWSDAHKDAYGFRPRGFMAELEAMSDEELQAAYDRLIDAVVKAIDEERAEKAAAQQEWAVRLDGMMADFNIDRATALRWDAQACGADLRYGWDHYCWELGLPYDLAPALEALVPAALVLNEKEV